MSRLLLIVEDEKQLARNMRDYLEELGYEVVICETLRSATSLYERICPDALLIDQNLPDGEGMDFIRMIRLRDESTRLLMITAIGQVELAVKAMKAGANDFLVKPVSLETLGLRLERIFEQVRNENSLRYLRRREEEESGLDCIHGNSAAVVDLKARLRLLIDGWNAKGYAADVPPVLIRGETGTGKGRIARALHFEGPRATRAFIEVNCALLSPEKIEPELFGLEHKPGMFLAAQGGTLFLDEIAYLPAKAQAMLLQAVDDHKIRAVGGHRDRSIDVRLVATTNAGLEDKIKNGEFRDDLFYRLNSVVLTSPPLRKRGDDVLLLAEEFIKEAARCHGRSNLVLADDAKQAMMAHSWPGNIRELRNTIEQVCMLSAGPVIHAADLNLRHMPVIAPEREGPAEPLDTPDATERECIIDALRKVNGNVTLAARMLSVSPDTLRYRLEKHRLSARNPS